MSNETMVFAKTDESEEALLNKARENEAEKYLIFLSDGLFYGVNADFVAEIITESIVTHLPMVPDHISGVINLRGQIVPIIDFRLMLGREPGEEYCTIVLDLDGTQIGILADSVDQMVDIEKGAILPMPTQQAQKLICGMCTLPNGNGTMMVLDCGLLLHG